MRLIQVTGGARSGKSAYAERRAIELGDDAVTFIATARPGDAEMARRIAHHKSTRPAAWKTLEAPVDAGAAILAASTEIVLLDCVTLLLSNWLELEGGRDDAAVRAALQRRTTELLRAIAARAGALVLVTNEVGLGIVPGNALARLYRDALGGVNQRIAADADEVVFMVSGLPLWLKGGPGA